MCVVVLDKGVDICIDFVGIGDWYVGSEFDCWVQVVVVQNGIDILWLWVWQVCLQDFCDFDYIVVMDDKNLLDLCSVVFVDGWVELLLLLDYVVGCEG